MIKTKFNGREILLYLSGQAMFELDEICVAWNDGHVERVSGMGELLTELDRERLQILAEAAEILQRAALGACRMLGRDEFDVVSAGEILALAKPLDVLSIRNAVMRAVVDGYKTDAGHDEPVDVFMIENQKKKINPDPGPSI